jgi:hypothetical protein
MGEFLQARRTASNRVSGCQIRIIPEKQHRHEHCSEKQCRHEHYSDCRRE